MATGDIEASVRAAIARLRQAMARVANGDVSAIKALYSPSADATSFYGWGGYEKGWEAVSQRWDWAGAQFKGGNVRYENISTVMTPDMFYVTDIETFENQLVANVDGPTGWSNRVTHIFRREAGEWRLVHRHGNRLEAQYQPSDRLGTTAS
ncbi:MAG: nuclear transport factor 2 family protein [bacterium]|nr:nuclear transport factor 2 family protein [bacterium]